MALSIPAGFTKLTTGLIQAAILSIFVKAVEKGDDTSISIDDISESIGEESYTVRNAVASLYGKGFVRFVDADGQGVAVDTDALSGMAITSIEVRIQSVQEILAGFEETGEEKVNIPPAPSREAKGWDDVEADGINLHISIENDPHSGSEYFMKIFEGDVFQHSEEPTVTRGFDSLKEAWDWADEYCGKKPAASVEAEGAPKKRGRKHAEN